MKTPKLLVAGLFLLSFCACRGPKTSRKPLYVFAAASLGTVLSDLEKSFERKYPEIDVLVEVSGSLVAARKVSEYKRRGDIVISADKRIIGSLLVPRFANWQIAFATNEIVLAFSENSRFGAELSSSDWPEILLRPEVRVARVDENLAPLGYQTLLVWKLADLHYEKELHGRSLFQALSQKVSRELIRPDAVEVLPMLGTEADYIFIYRSTAIDQNLKHILLPAEVNLSSFSHADSYSRASMTISSASGVPLTIQGEPIHFSLTILRDAPNRGGALSFVKALLGPEGRGILHRHGFLPITPARFYGPPESLPEVMRDFVSESASSAEASI
jgi:molybdate/tungstate transport system substrate-binding protein